MTDYELEMLKEIKTISSLLELLAEDKIAQRDSKQRTTLLELVGTSSTMQKSVLLMDGTRTQKDIRTATGAHQGNLSTLIGKLQKAKLLIGETKTPHLSISLPKSFFDSNAQTN